MSANGDAPTSRWAARDDVARGDDYDARWAHLEAAGESVHGEADLIEALWPGAGRVLDAGCGTGRVAIELQRRGIDTVGVDLDPEMLSTARAKAPEMQWHQADLARLDLGEDRFSVVAAPGNVMIFLALGSEAAVIGRLAAHLEPDGLLVAGFQLGGDRLDLDAYDAHAAAAGLTLHDRWSTWDRAPFVDGPGADYAVTVHRLER